MVTVPAVVIAAPASASGKTTVATGLIGALRQAGHAVAAFKVGPDFIDPGYHALAAGRVGRNLDPVLVGEKLIGPLYAHGAAGADIAVIEGVMGLFDGRIESGARTAASGSTAHVAALLGAPVVLVVDARGQSQSIAALLHGFSTFDTATRIAGVVLNRVGSARHEQVLRQACEQAGAPVLGAIPRDDELEVPSRYLGLVTAVEYDRRARHAVEAMTALIARHVDVAAVFALARSRVVDPAWDPSTVGAEPVGERITVALAGGKSFSFGYPEHAELLRARRRRRETSSTRSSTRCPTAPMPYCCRVGFPSSSPPNCPAMRSPAARSMRWRPPGRRFMPNAPGCSTWFPNSTDTRCAAC